jgi:Fe-S cluster biosynthesis and repair protein YggX
MDIDQRIAQFENMVQADPENDMAYFSLGGAYNQAGRFAEAADAFLKCAQINKEMSKAYQLAGAALMACNRADDAALILTEGYTIAAERGDLMPKNAIAELLTKLGRPIPETQTNATPAAPAFPEGTFVCKCTGQPGTKMARPPFRGPVGAWIADNISQETFQAWIGQGTKVINELRLDLSRDEDEKVYDENMREFLGIDDALFAELMSQGV